MQPRLSLKQIAEALGGASEMQNGSFAALCPCHDDKIPSFSLAQSDEGKLLVHCHAGCSQEQLISALKKRQLWPTNASHNSGANKKRRIVAVYDYLDPKSGNLKFQVVRYEPKDFRQRRPNDNGGWEWNVPKSEAILFNLPEIQSREGMVFVVEGEKDVIALKQIGLLATCNAGGAGKWRKDFAPYLAGRDICILPDNDNAGSKHAELVASSLHNVASTVRVLELSPLPPKGDVSDWLSAGGSASKLLTLAKKAAQWAPSQHKDSSNTVDTKHLDIGSDVEIAQKLHEFLCRQYGDIVYCEGQFWRFCSTHWEPIDENELRRICHLFDGATYPSAANRENVVRLGKGRIDSVIRECQSICNEPEFFSTTALGINCASGFIQFNKDGEPQLHPHDRSHRCRHVLSGKWNGNIPEQLPPDSLLNKLLTGSFRNDDDANDKIALLAEIAGVTALGYATHLQQPRAVILYGQTAENGKSQILDLIRGLLPKAAICSIPVAKMTDEKRVVGLVGKLLNASDELSSEAISSDIFKALVTGEPVDGRDVFKSRVEFRAVAQHLFATNILPPFKGGFDRGVQRRLLVIPFDRTVPIEERIEHIGQKIADNEADLVLAWAIGGAIRVIHQRNYSIPASSKNALREWIFSADLVQAWAHENVIAADPLSDPAIPSKICHSSFVEWAINQGYNRDRLPAINVFSQRLRSCTSAQFVRGKNGGRLIKGIKIIPFLSY